MWWMTRSLFATISKPFYPELLLMTVEKILREKRMLKEIRDLRKEIDQRYSFGKIIGKNHEMRIIYELIQRLAPADASILIIGETGIGKELVVKAYISASPRWIFNSIHKPPAMPVRI